MEYLSYITCFLGTFLCFLPMMIDLEFDLSSVDDLENIPLEKALSTRSYAFSIVSGIAVSFPIVLELIADIYSGQRENFHAVFSKWTLLVALVIPNTIILLVICPYTYYQAMPSIYNARLILIVFAFMTFMRNYGAPIWTPRITYSLMLSMTTSFVIDSFEAYVDNYKYILVIIRISLVVVPLLITIASTSYTELVFTVSLTVLNGRTARRALLIERLSDLKLDNDMICIVEDLRNSTDIAVEILNDLLTYEKLTANILQLDKSVIAIQRFVNNTVHPFELQARAKNVNLRLIFDNINNNIDNMEIFGRKSNLSTFRRRSIDAVVEFSQWLLFMLFSSESQRRIHHTTTSTTSDNNSSMLTYLRIDVTDTGPGISK
eukprot:gene3159-6231_t